MNRRTAKLFRASVALLTLSAWLSISNHCAIGGLIAAKTPPAAISMHCHSTQTPQPSKKSDGEEMPCCKMLRATVTTDAKIAQAASKDFLPIDSWIVGEMLFAIEPQSRPQELDTGPPRGVTFAESVLQRSILAHAPPALV